MFLRKVYMGLVLAAADCHPDEFVVSKFQIKKCRYKSKIFHPIFILRIFYRSRFSHVVFSVTDVSET